jgi:ABC-2 type transport system ATP-binding protein
MLEIQNLTKRYRELPAVDNISFILRPREVCGYLGPNGSGKTTTIKMLIGLLEPSEGRVLYRGQPVARDLIDFKRRVGYVPEEPHLYTYLTGAEYLELTGQLHGIPAARLERKIAWFLRLFSLASDRFTPLSAYSKGMKQKILIAAALMHDPEIVVLDEPFSGLDVSSAMVLKQLLHSLAAAGKIVLYSSHVLEVVEKVCSRVIILHQGRIVADDSVARLRDLMKLPNLEEIFSQLVIEQDSEQVADELMEAMRA